MAAKEAKESTDAIFAANATTIPTVPDKRVASTSNPLTSDSNGENAGDQYGCNGAHVGGFSSAFDSDSGTNDNKEFNKSLNNLINNAKGTGAFFLFSWVSKYLMKCNTGFENSTQNPNF